MAGARTPVDISELPELAHPVDEVRRSGEARILRQAGEDVAMLSPIKEARGRSRQARTEEGRRAFLSAAGGWNDRVDTDQLIADVRASRRRSIRPPVEG